MDSFFDWKFYINYYEDLKNANISNQEEAWNHLIHHGIYEHRLKKISNTFDWIFYINYYDDLKDAGIDNEEKALNHWNNHGINEKRIYNNTLLYGKCNLNDTNDTNDTNKYIPNTDILEYIKKYSCNNYKEFLNRHEFDSFYHAFLKKNHIDFDFEFYKEANNINSNISNNELIDHIHNYGVSGLIYHPKQLLNIFPNINIFKIDDKIYIKYNNKNIKLNKFIKKYIYSKTFDELCNKLIKNIYNNLCSSSLLLLVFIGYVDIGEKLINKIIKYKSIENFNISFCFNSLKIYNNFKNKIDKNFTNYSIYISHEFGNDITPTLLMYNEIKKKYVFNHIIKLQTKSYEEQMNELTDFLLSKKLNVLISSKRNDCNCIGIDKYYMKIKDDIFNQELIEKFNDKINNDYSFIIGTIFYTDSITFNNVLYFIKNNDTNGFLLNNLYDSNRIIYKKSYVHYLERLFGIIKK
jgi:hypothetical protein